jgi:son of sevenless-like protein
MRGPQTEALRRSLHLSIDPTPYREATSSTSESSPSPILSTRASVATTHTAYSVVPAEDDWRLCSVFCLYDFESRDPDHLGFRKGEVLDVVKQEDTGWWAAMRRGGNRVGWIPCSFVQAYAEETAQTIESVNSALQMWSPEEKYSRPGPVRRNSEFSTMEAGSRRDWEALDLDEEYVCCLTRSPMLWLMIASGSRPL